MEFPELSDRVLWLMLPVALATTVLLASSLTHQLRDATAAPETAVQPTAKKVDDDAEEHIPPEALKIISDGYSFELRKAVFKIASTQSLKDAPKALLLKDISSKDPERRDRAVTALFFLIHGQDEYDTDFQFTSKQQQQEFQNLPAYRALVNALVNLLPSHTDKPTDLSYSISGHPPSPVRPLFRTATETVILKILIELLRSSKRSTSPPEGGIPEGGIPTLLKAGIIKRWLRIYPFPCTLPLYSGLNYKRADVASLLSENALYAHDDQLMADLFRELLHHPVGQRELQASGLLYRSSRIRERFAPDSSDRFPPSIWNATTYTDAGWQTILPSRSDLNGIDLPRPRSGERSAEEERLRRRHREAVVVADPDRPVSGHNILQRMNSAGPPRRGSSEEELQVRSARLGRRAGGEGGGGGGISDEDSERESMASRMSFSEVGNVSSTPDSMPSLQSVDAERRAEHERVRREELERRLGANVVAVAEAEAEEEIELRATAEEILGNILERALQARERSRAEGNG